MRAVIFLAILAYASAWTASPARAAARLPAMKRRSSVPLTRVSAFGPPQPGEERPTITRENEADEYFQTNLDKASDSEKIKVALIGAAFIALPFIVGMGLYLAGGAE